MKLCAAPITYIFILFGLMFFIPGYPILCGAFFTTLGIFQGFQYAREASDIQFSALLPIAKRDIVKGKYLFVCFIEMCSLLLMLIVTLIRMTALSDSVVYRQNALMNANFFAIGGALLVFGLFNVIFLGGFFRTAYNQGKPFVIYIIAAFLLITVLEALHYIPGMGELNAFGTDHMGLQIALLAAGMLLYAGMSFLSYNKACTDFEKIDL